MENMLITWTIASILIMSPTTKAASLICYKGSITDFKELSLEESPQFVNTAYMPENCNLNMVIHGYSTNVSVLIENVIENLIQKFGDTGCYCALNWEKEAAAYLGSITKPIEYILGLQALGFDYPIASLVAGLQVAPSVCKAITEMQTRGLNASKAHIIGHSEGAHLAGNVADCLKQLGTLIAQVTGLDNAKPTLQDRLKAGVAQLVVCIHTDPFSFGTNLAICDIDIWVNYGFEVQPGCPKNTVALTPENFCSHQRALIYFAEGILNSKSFPCRRANNFQEYLNSSGTPDPGDVNYIGSDVKPNVTGNCYLCTNAEPEFGKGPAGMDPSSCI